MNRKDPIAYAKASCDTMMKNSKLRSFRPPDNFIIIKEFSYLGYTMFTNCVEIFAILNT